MMIELGRRWLSYATYTCHSSDSGNSIWREHAIGWDYSRSRQRRAAPLASQVSGIQSVDFEIVHPDESCRAGPIFDEMVLAKVKDEPFESEMMPTVFVPVPMPLGVSDLKKARLMLITDGGLVPKGNPDKIQSSAATRWGRIV